MNVYYCVLFSSRVRVRIRVRIRFGVWLVSRYAHVFVVVWQAPQDTINKVTLSYPKRLLSCVNVIGGGHFEHRPT